MSKAIATGALVAIVGLFPAAALVALVYGFPIPFDGRRSGIDAVAPSFFAVLYYGVFGGFAVMWILGGLAGALAVRLTRHDQAARGAWVAGLALAAALIAVLVAAVLDDVLGRG